MSLDITPTPAQTSAGAGTPSASGTATPALAALFGLLLAQTVSQAAPTASKAATQPAAVGGLTQPLVTANNLVSTTVSDIKAASITTDPTAVKTKNKGKDTAAQNAALLLPVTTVLIPSESPAPATSKKAMDTAPTQSSELPVSASLSKAGTSIIVPTEQTLPVSLGENVIVPTETAPTTLPASATPQTPIVPIVAAQQAEPISLAASLKPMPMPRPAIVPAKTTSTLQKPIKAADNQAVTEASNNTSLDSTNVVAATTATVLDTLPAKSNNNQTPSKTDAEGAVTATSTSSATASATLPVPTLSVNTSPTAAPMTASPMPPADRTQMLHQVSEALQTMTVRAVGNGQQQVTVQLHPKDWGQVNVSVTMTPTTQADGSTTTQVIAHITADQPAVKAALETHQLDLRQSLKDAGLNLDRMTVTVRPPDGGAQAGLGDGRRESRGDEGNPSGSGSWAGTTTQGGSLSGSGGNASSFAAFAQNNSGGQGRYNPVPSMTALEQSAEPETAALSDVTLSGRIDTHA
jgi:flagellar hook-length control protein FliK